MRPLTNIRGIPGISLLGNAGMYTFGNFLSPAVNVLLLPVFTRFLSQSEYGILAYTTSLNVFLFVVASFNVHAYVLRRRRTSATGPRSRSARSTSYAAPSGPPRPGTPSRHSSARNSSATRATPRTGTDAGIHQATASSAFPRTLESHPVTRSNAARMGVYQNSDP